MEEEKINHSFRDVRTDWRIDNFSPIKTHENTCSGYLEMLISEIDDRTFCKPEYGLVVIKSFSVHDNLSFDFQGTPLSKENLIPDRAQRQENGNAPITCYVTGRCEGECTMSRAPPLHV